MGRDIEGDKDKELVKYTRRRVKLYVKRFLISCFIIILTSGCLQPLKKWNAAIKKEDKTEQKIDSKKEETAEKAKTFIHGTGTALKLDPSPSKYSDVALTLNQRAELTLGQPSYQDSLVIDKIVVGLLSTNEQIKAEAKKSLDIKDSEIVKLQTQLKDLGVKLETIQGEKDVLGLKNSVLGQKWSNLMVWIKWIFWGIIFIFVFRVVMAVVPPPYNSLGFVVDGVFGVIGKFIFRALPKAREYANVVKKDVFDVSEQTLKSLVAAVQDIRNKEIKPSDAINNDPVKISSIIDPILKDKTDEITRPKITAIKQQLGHI